MNENDVNAWQRYLSGTSSEEEKKTIESRLEAEPLYKDQLLAFMLVQDSLAVLGHEAAIEAELDQKRKAYREEELHYERRKEEHTPFEAVFEKITKRNLWTVLGGVACVLVIVVSTLWWPNEPTIARIKVQQEGISFYEKDSLTLAFYKRNGLFGNSKPEYQWQGDTLKLYALEPTAGWEIRAIEEKNTYLLYSKNVKYKIKEGQLTPTQLLPYHD
ncbi:hypothetical protein P1X15_08695 [Runella sp. MFBS21]|uniref:hypothetical protein n=1 Tax=Runella sp. MFBS21 TaxID=3034018 RepID=UPI0023F9B536|nr:hypothetical protein [Runella sp. MFBS21]MDF7817672.1 hypothetical protein [Runella sp. MFBS21]